MQDQSVETTLINEILECFRYGNAKPDFGGYAEIRSVDVLSCYHKAISAMDAAYRLVETTARDRKTGEYSVDDVKSLVVELCVAAMDVYFFGDLFGNGDCHH